MYIELYVWQIYVVLFFNIWRVAFFMAIPRIEKLSYRQLGWV